LFQETPDRADVRVLFLHRVRGYFPRQ
jgi:hypothetical protein